MTNKKRRAHPLVTYLKIVLGSAAFITIGYGPLMATGFAWDPSDHVTAAMVGSTFLRVFLWSLAGSALLVGAFHLYATIVLWWRDRSGSQ